MIRAIGPIRLKALLGLFRSPERILKASSEELMKAKGISASVAAKIVAQRDEAPVDQEIGSIEKNNVTIITIDDAAYPYLLKNIYDPPFILYVKGALIPEDILSVAIVGTRNPTVYGKEQAEKFGYELSMAGITVVSGFARGIDTAAHKGAIKAGGRTIAVLGSGFDHIYPPENERLFDEVCARGAVISEYPMCMGPLRQNFPLRNRIISGLSRGVCVVEAGTRSGALITAAFARDEGREVFSLPGRVDSANSRGTLSLIQEGAKLVQGVQDIIDELGGVSSSNGDSFLKMAAPPVALEGDEQKIFECLGESQVHIDDIDEQVRIGINKVAHSLVRLQLRGLVKELPGKKYIRVSCR